MPKESFDSVEHGTASWYGPGFHGRKTANGERYDQRALTAAHRTLQLPSILRVTNLDNGKSIIVRVNDRGPFAHNRIIDLSAAGAKKLEYRRKGLAKVTVEVLTGPSKKIAAMARANKSVSAMTQYVAELNTSPDAVIRNSHKQLANTSSTAAGSWFLQAAAFGDAGNADRARARLRGVGPTRILARPRGDQTLYLVRVGPYASKQQAQEALQQIREVGFNDALMVASS
ncbi:MAG: septal ring lytic transglycosylase RlpA family protein [Alphaproteobacteria bacterium]|jgi:rare lipoprotein A